MQKFTAKDFSREEIYKIAEAYSTGKYTYHNFMKVYGCNKKTFYTIINWAVVKCIVPDEIVRDIEIVSTTNSYNKANNLFSSNEDTIKFAKRGMNCNKLRLLKRNNYIFPKSETISLINDYISSPDSKMKFCKSHYMTTKVFDNSLKEAIVKGWITLATVEKLRTKACMFNKHADVDELFNRLIFQRKQYKISK